METIASLLGAKLDAKTKFKLLDMLDERPVAIVDELDPVRNAFRPEMIDSLIRDEVDYIIADGLFDREMLEKCRDEAEEACEQEGLMKEAGFGRGDEKTTDKKIRGDRFIWLTKLDEFSALK